MTHKVAVEHMSTCDTNGFDAETSAQSVCSVFVYSAWYLNHHSLEVYTLFA